MNAHVLKSPREAERVLAELFSHGTRCELSVREDKAFINDGWLKLGELTLQPENGEDKAALLDGVHRGAFEWRVNACDSVETDLVTLLAVDDRAKSGAKLRRIIDSIAAIGVRAGLVYPQFDPHALEMMPFRRSTTVVADTSGAIQGGLDFVARHLHPAARIKIPAIVQMEIVNFSDRFLSCRRATRTRRADLLIDHLRSQGGQRVLLRLELSADTEIERTFLLGDPLRSAFQKDYDPELSELNLSVEIKGYADRLILEAARQHQAQANFGHKVQLLTSDQGLARMALAEGIAPLYFSSVVGTDFLGKSVTGVSISPFTGSIREISLTSVLWEFATAFGSVKLASYDHEHFLEISAFGEALSWSPYQSHGDLLWCSAIAIDGLLQANSEHDDASGDDGLQPEERIPTDDAVVTENAAPIQVDGASTPVSSSSKTTIFRPNVEKLFLLIDALDDRQKLSEDEAIKIIAAKSSGGLDEYRRFLTSGGLIRIESGEWQPEAGIKPLAIALRTEEPVALRDCLLNVPSFKMLADNLAALPIGTPLSLSDLKRGLTTYTVLAECTRIGVMLYEKGIFSTPCEPSPKDFAKLAQARFKELDKGDGLVATGSWLETLVEKDGIHPETAKRLLNDASSKGLLRRTTEGSTLETSFDKHVLHVLRQKNGKPEIREVHLYRGDYLIPDKSSVSLRIEGPAA
ncbi:PIN domain-containing protein [Rhizobium leguminosarum]|uniref:PIN domain-containing protein n=1 Tax=Rhizobium leguminosarum TaxID=384 RepID=UPI001C90EE0B|nr:PIN domain-containing protein [Rhizobium leguminosarum]MBY2985105.1 hypothetical protein [Rhizobium leguminosarum]